MEEAATSELCDSKSHARFVLQKKRLDVFFSSFFSASFCIARFLPPGHVYFEFRIHMHLLYNVLYVILYFKSVVAGTCGHLQTSMVWLGFDVDDLHMKNASASSNYQRPLLLASLFCKLQVASHSAACSTDTTGCWLCAEPCSLCTAAQALESCQLELRGRPPTSASRIISSTSHLSAFPQ